MTAAVLVISNINVDLIYEVERMPLEHEKILAAGGGVEGGGSGANTAHWLAQLGVPVHVSGFVGEDVFGDFAVGRLATAGVDVSACVRLPGRTTSIAGIFSSGAAKSMVISGIEYAAEAVDTLIAATSSLDWSRIGHIHLATRDRTLISRVMTMPEAAAVPVSLELDGIYDAALVRRAGIVFSNMDELARATSSDDPAAFVASAHAGDDTAFFITEGARGARIVCRGHVTQVPAVPVEPVDRTGGGDAFDAGVLASCLRGENHAACAARGLALAAFVIRNRGARPPADAALLQRIGA